MGPGRAHTPKVPPLQDRCLSLRSRREAKKAGKPKQDRIIERLGRFSRTIVCHVPLPPEFSPGKPEYNLYPVGPDLQKLRRFALAIALVLISYSLAGVSLKADETIRPLGLPFSVGSPQYLGIGLMLASLYSAIRFYYYGILFGQSPRQHRRRVFDHCKSELQLGLREIASAGRIDDVRVMDLRRRVLNQLEEAYPKPAATPKWTAVVTFGRGVPENAQIEIPKATRLLGLLSDVDYTAPVWLNLIALGLAFWKIL